MSLLAGEITLGLLLRFAAPTILSFVFLNIYFVIDGIFVSRAVGTSGLAAVNLAMPLLNDVKYGRKRTYSSSFGREKD